MEKIIKHSIHIFIILALLTLTQCATKSASVAAVPDNVLGIRIGMNKADAEKHLKEIGKFSRAERKRQQVWSINNHPSYSHAAIGFDKEEKVSYIAAYAKLKDGQSVRYDEIADLKSAKAEITEPNRRYVWEVPERPENAPYSVTAHGTTPEHLSMLTLARTLDKNEEEEEEGEERKEREEKK